TRNVSGPRRTSQAAMLRYDDNRTRVIRAPVSSVIVHSCRSLLPNRTAWNGAGPAPLGGCRACDGWSAGWLLVVLLALGLAEAGCLGGFGGGEPDLGLGLVVVLGVRLVVEHRVGVALDRVTLGLGAVLEGLVAALAVRALVQRLDRLGLLGLGGDLGR